MNPVSYECFERIHAEWEYAHPKATSAPLCAGLHLRPSAVTSFDYQQAIGFAPANYRPSEEYPPSFICEEPQRRKPIFDAESIFSNGVTLLRKLSGPSDSWCEVWLVQLQDGTEMAIKLYQIGLFPEPKWDNYNDGHYWTHTEMAGAESWAYNTLKPLQGSVIPYSYGFYDFVLPSGLTVCGHVMEFIQGRPLARDWQAMQDAPRWYSPEEVAKREERMEYFMAIVQEFHRYGVAHRDLRGGNVLCLPGDPESLVVIDFGLAGPLYHPQRGTIFRYSWQREVGGVVDCLTLIDECPAVARWLQKRLPENPPWGRLLRLALLRLKEKGSLHERDMREAAGLPVC